MRFIFEWDERKNAANIKKHGIAFKDAAYVFEDPLHKRYPDRSHRDEERYIAVGFVRNIIMMVVHTMQEIDDGCTLVRIISARKTDKSERKRYENDF